MWLPDDPELAPFVSEYSAFCRTFYARETSASDWRSWQSRRLREVLERASSGSPFYAKHLAGIDLAAVSPDSISVLPFTTKQHLREHLFDVLSGDISEATFFYETTGTTGPATPCPRDAHEVIASNYHVSQSWAAIFAHHFGSRRPAVGLMGPTEVHSFGDTLGDVARNVGSCSAKIWPYSPVIGFNKALALMRDLRLDVICCTPGVCMNLAKAARHYGFDLRRDFNVSLIFLTGEMCTDALARNVSQIWGADTYNILYGSQEAFVIGVACKNGAMHLSAPNYLVEVIDPETLRTVGDVGTGELCVTTLIAGVKPLIRYRTGDLVSIRDNDCGCELPGSTMEVVGRVLDRIALNGRPRMASELETAVLEDVTGCCGYQIVIDQRNGEDHVDIRLEFVDCAGAAAAQTAVGDRFERAFGVPADVTVVDELDQIVSTAAFVSWKAARILDRRVAPDHEQVVAARLAERRGYET